MLWKLIWILAANSQAKAIEAIKKENTDENF
jgi:hypothetical protein